MPDILKKRAIPQNYFDNIDLRKFLIVLAYEVDALGVLNTLAERHYKGIILGGDSWSVQTPQIASHLDTFESVCIVNPVPYDLTARSERNRKFVAEYRVKYGEPPSDVAALAFDAGSVISMAAMRCAESGERRACMADAISRLHLTGVSGEVGFSTHGKRVNPGVLLKSQTCASLEREYGYFQ